MLLERVYSKYSRVPTHDKSSKKIFRARAETNLIIFQNQKKGNETEADMTLHDKSISPGNQQGGKLGIKSGLLFM
jgi:hypothetical protein